MIPSTNTANGADPLAVGWYGKLPGNGDFLTRRLPHAFVERWDGWLRTVVAGSRLRLGGEWRDAFLSMPAWRFLLEPGVAGEDAWAGLLVPSVDAVGRYFPLTAACRLPARSLDAAATLLRARPWYADLEAVVLGVLAPGADRTAFDEALAARRFDPASIVSAASATTKLSQPKALWLPLPGDGEAAVLELAAAVPAPRSLWLAEDSEVLPQCLLAAVLLPEAEQFCAMMNGRGADHGWALAQPATTA